MDISIQFSVGENGRNKKEDVEIIQKALNHIMQFNILAPLKALKEDGFAGKNTKYAIRRFQQVALGVLLPDGRVDPHGNSLKKLNAIILKSKKLPDFSIFKRRVWSANTMDELLCETFRQFNSVQFNLLAGQPAHRAQTLNNIGALSKSEFVRKVFDSAKTEALLSQVPAAVTTAQAILETGYGKAVPIDLYTQQYSYNLFGIKGVGTAGSVSVYTHEVINGKRIKIIDKFQAYRNFDESISGRTKFLKENRRYKFLFKTSDAVEWAEGLQQAGYATDPNYSKLLISIMNSWKLI